MGGVRAGARQRGAALLLTLLLLLVVGSAALLARSNARLSMRVDDPDRTLRAMQQAKEALIGFAVTGQVRPGELPCPDLDNDGLSLPGIEYAGATCTATNGSVYVGWLPYRLLRVGELQDGGASRLWYALSPDYANAGASRPALNSRTPGQLTLDGTGDIVALVIAPGSAHPDQSRNVVADACTDRWAYLDADNADSPLPWPPVPCNTGNASFVNQAAGDFNDRVLAITRAELMGRVEKRVLREVNVTLRNYHAAAGQFPWLKDYEEPQTAVSFRHDAATARSEGLLSLHARPGPCCPGPGVLEEQLEDGFHLRWRSLDNSTITPTPDPVTGLISVRASDMVDSPLDPVTGFRPGLPVTEAQGHCVWTVDSPNEGARANCAMNPGQKVRLNDFMPYPRLGEELTPGDPATTVKSGTRDFEFSFDIVDGTRTVTAEATAALVERRRRVLMDVTKPNTLRIVVTDQVVTEGPDPGTDTDDVTVNSSMQLDWISAAAASNVRVSDIPYRLDPMDELPTWFEPNGWHRLVYVVLSPSMQPGGGGDCAAAGDCVSLRIDGAAVLPVELVAATLSMRDQAAGATGVPGDYLELDNASTGDRVVERAPYSPTFDDQVDALEKTAGVPPMDILR